MSNLSVHEAMIHIPRLEKKASKGEVLNVTDSILTAIEFYSLNYHSI